MLKKYFAILLALGITTLTLSFPMSTSAQKMVDSEKTKSKVQSLSAKTDNKVEMKLRDNTKYKGYITTVEADYFTLSDSKTSKPQKFLYSEVLEVKKSGGGLSTKTLLILGGVAAGTITTWLIVKPAFCDGGAQTRGIC